MRRFIDLSIYLENDVVSDPPPMRPRLTTFDTTLALSKWLTSLRGLINQSYPTAKAGRSRWFSCVLITVRTSMRRTTITAP